MNKLREKLLELDVVVYKDLFKLTIQSAEHIEQITDDFSVKFALWLANCEDIDFVDAENEEESVKQLLQIFKNQYYGN